MLAFSASNRVGGGGAGSTSGPPFAVVAVARTVLAPALRFTVMVRLCQVSQLPVLAKDSSSATSAPLTNTSIGRFVVDPLANRIVTVAGPAAAALTVHCTELPTTLL